MMRDNYIDGTCPNCDLAIPEDAEDGSECSCCGHVFWSCNPDDGRYDDPVYYEAMPHPCENEFGEDYRFRRNI